MLTEEQQVFQDEVIQELLSSTGHAILVGLNELSLSIVEKAHKLGLSNTLVCILDNKKRAVATQLGSIPILNTDEVNTAGVQLLIICEDRDKEYCLQILRPVFDNTLKVLIYGNSNYDFDDPVFDEIVSSLHVKSKAGGYPFMMIHLYQCIKHIVANEIPGDVVEFGVFRGGTTVFLAKCLKALHSTKAVWGFDSFAGFPGKKSYLDLFDSLEYGNVDLHTVKSYCAPHNIHLIKGDISETWRKIKDAPLSMCFFDTDNYTATKNALSNLFDSISVGGIIAFDHYYSKDWVKTIGERIAAKEVLGNKAVFNLHGTGIFLKL